MIMKKWVVIIPGKPGHLDAYGKTETEARAWIRNGAGYKKLPVGTIVRTERKDNRSHP